MEGITATPVTAWSVRNHLSQQIKKSRTTIISWVNIEIQLTTRATWITASIQRKWKFHASFTTSKVYCFYFIVIFTIAIFWWLFLWFSCRYIICSYPVNLDSIFCIIAILCSGYNAHLVRSAINSRHGKITVIPNNMERYTAFAINDITLIDYCHFMLSSFDKFSRTLTKTNSGDQKVIRVILRSTTKSSTKQQRDRGWRRGWIHACPWRLSKPPLPSCNTHVRSPKLIEEDWALIIRKGVYPYECMDLFERFQEPVTNQRLLLFANFRDVCLQHYDLDPTHNYNAPGLSWQVALKMTDVELDLLTDTDKHVFIEEGIRAGVANINHRYARANTLGKENYDTSKRNSYIMYLDANNLYGWAM